MHLGLISSRSEKAVDRNGGRVFRKDCFVKGLRPPKAALRALDKTILSKLLLAVAIDGTLRPECQLIPSRAPSTQSSKHDTRCHTRVHALFAGRDGVCGGSSS